MMRYKNLLSLAIASLAVMGLLVTTPQLALAKKAPAKKSAKATKKSAKSHGSGSIWDKDEAVVPIEDQVAIRHRYELRKGRFEVGPSFGFTLNRAFMNAFMVGARAQYHINDYLSVGTEWQFGINFRSPLANELGDTYNNGQTNPRTGETFDGTMERVSRLKLVGDLRVAFTPLSGKMGVFSALFIGYDFYAFAGMAFGLTGNDYSNTGTKVDDPDATNEGFNLGFAWGLGLHIYVNNWISIGLEFKDLMFNDNETGQDVTRGLEGDEQESCNNGNPCRLVNSDDRRFLNHFFFGFNVTFFLPTRPEIAF